MIYSPWLGPGDLESAAITGHVLVVAAPAMDTERAGRFAPLPDAIEEARMVSLRFPSHVLLSGQDATIDAVERELPRAVVFHFAGHSWTTADATSLLLARPVADTDASDGLLTPARWPRDFLRSCRLAVLSACATDPEQDDESADPQYLVRAFLAAGARNVVASRWNVDSRATGRLMELFYSSLAAGETPSRALQSAASALRRRAETEHPFYWAAFSVYGG